MNVLISTQIGVSRELPRLWLEGSQLERGGVVPGMKLIVNVCEKLRRVELRPAPDGQYTGNAKVITVSKRTNGDNIKPILELRDELLRSFFGIGAKVRVAIQRGRILVSESHISFKIRERVSRFLEKMKNKEPLKVGSLYHGGMILDGALHRGLQRVGVNSLVQIGIEYEPAYTDCALRNQPELWSEDATILNGDIRDFVFGQSIPQLDLVFAGLPCTGASRSGVAKLHLACAEEHENAGSLFHNFLNFVQAANPAIIVVENVVEYLKSQSMVVIRSVLQSLGYVLNETVIDGWELGCLEKRKRMCLVATTPGACEKIDFNQLVPIKEREAKLSDVLDHFPADHEAWKPYTYLAEKEVRDIAAGKGFRRQLLTGEEDGCGTITRGYFKARSTDPYVLSPFDSSLSRLFSVAEHARVKAVPVHSVDGVSATVAHEILGQSVCAAAFEAVGYLIGRTIMGHTAVTVLAPEIALLPAEEPAQELVQQQIALLA